jgi:single-stranded DNA-binding protein
MYALNSFIGEGFVKGPVLFWSAGAGEKACAFCMANVQGGEVNVLRVEALGELADVMERRRHNFVRVVGRLKQYRWIEDDGTLREAVRVVAADIELKPAYDSLTPPEQAPAQRCAEAALPFDCAIGKTGVALI